MAQITYADKTALYQNADVAAENKVRDVDMNEIKEVVNDNETKILLDVTNTAPAECSTGDMYFNTTDNLIYTATATDTWGSTGVAPTENTIYVVISTQTSYVYNGITLVSVGSASGSVVNNYSTSITEGYSCNYVNNIINYSTTEVNTGVKWIDNKPIYRKVINFGALPDTSTKAVAHDISNLDTIIDYKALAKSVNATLPIPYMALTVSYGIYMYFDATNITVETGYNRSAYSMYVVLEYTKTTD